MFGQTRLEFIFGVIIFTMIIFYIVSQINSTFSNAINDYEIDTMKAKALNTIKTLVETEDIERNYTVEVPIDVVLINDMSGSMDGSGTNTCKLRCNTFGDHSCTANHGCTCPSCNDCDNNGFNADPDESPCSINDAKNAAEIFVDLLNSTSDRSSLVTFNSSAYRNQHLTFDKNLVKNAVNVINGRDNTGIAYGIGNATKEFSDYPRSEAKKVEILLTDGRDDLGIPCCTGTANSCCTDVEGAALTANSSDITIYTIGLGSTSYLNETLLRKVADITGGRYFYVPSSDQLAGIYEEIAYEIKSTVTKVGIITSKPYIVSQEKVYNLSQSCDNLNIFDLKTYRLKVYNSTNLLLFCGTDSMKPPRIFVSKYVWIGNDLGNVTLEMW